MTVRVDSRGAEAVLGRVGTVGRSPATRPLCRLRGPWAGFGALLGQFGKGWQLGGLVGDLGAF